MKIRNENEAAKIDHKEFDFNLLSFESDFRTNFYDFPQHCIRYFAVMSGTDVAFKREKNRS